MSDAARRWARDLESWAIPARFVRAGSSPFAFSVPCLQRAAHRAVGRRTTSSEVALDALPEGGSVVDVGCGAGAASMPLAGTASRIVGVDESSDMLDAFTAAVEATGVEHRAVRGRWPDVAEKAGTADVVVCHHVLYNVAEIEPFLTALTASARARVVVEITARHPLAWLSPLWKELQGLDRPERPVAEDAVDVARGLGLDVSIMEWEAPSSLKDLPGDELVRFVRERLCLDEERDEELVGALERHPLPEVRPVVTMWWPGSAP